MSEIPTQTVFVVDDDEAMRNALYWLLESVNLAVQTFATAGDFLESYQLQQGGCLLLDVRMPGMSGMEFLEQHQARGIRLPVIMITGHGDVPMAVRALRHGAFDFIQKPFNGQELLDRVHAALKLDHENRPRYSYEASLRQDFKALTAREREIMELVVAGNSSKQAARVLGISARTVDIHRANVMRKLKVRTIAELVQVRLACQDN